VEMVLSKPGSGRGAPNGARPRGFSKKTTRGDLKLHPRTFLISESSKRLAPDQIVGKEGTPLNTWNLGSEVGENEAD